MTAAGLEGQDGLLRLTTLFKIVAAVLLGVLIGLAITINSLDLDRHGTRIGPWRSTPRDGGSDPYALAADARAGLLPLGTAEGLTFVAASDGTGAALEGRCDYVVEGPMPGTRYWTLSLLDAQGFPIANPANRFGFTSAEVLRFSAEPVTVAVSSQARPGNWLPVGKQRDFMLMLRLYDTSLSVERASFSSLRMPAIKRTGCR